ncbi:MAG: phage shock protein [Patescibacteria group bacterium]|nr:PspC domain-containing protein [Candidatus Saccharibacteria bacterium]MDQ5963470.1 phage shock protein [Patescibacteria group bacterium]
MKKLYRSNTNKMIAGICGGLEAYTNIDATIWRILFVLIALPGGISIFVYFILWFIIPDDSSS